MQYTTTKEDDMNGTANLDYGTPTGRWNAVATIFEAAWGPLYADEDHTEALWGMTEPSAELVSEDGDMAAVCAETAKRVAAAIALMAYGVDAVEARAGMLPTSAPVV
jgi:hypothetical protein